MAKVTGGESNLLGGVSQQPVDRRLRGSVSAQVNTITNVLRGIERRPPMSFIPVTVSDPLYTELVWLDFTLDGFTYLLRVEYEQNSATELYITVIRADGLQAVVTVEPSTIPYITSMTPEQMSITATADGIYLLNPTVTTRMSAQTTLPPYGAYVEMTGTNYGRDYSILIDYVIKSKVTIPVDTTGLAPADIQSESIISQLDAGFTDTNYQTNFSGSTMFIIPTADPYEYMNLQAFDGDNNNYLYVAQRVIPSVNKLPKAAVKDTILTVRPNDGGKESEYYLKYTDKQDLYENETGTTPPPPPEEEFDQLYITGASKFDYTGNDARGYATVLGNGATNLSPDTLLGGTITDLFVTTTSNDNDPFYNDQRIILRHESTTLPLPTHISMEMDGVNYVLVYQDDNTYMTDRNYDGYTTNPYGYMKSQGNGGIVGLYLRNLNVPVYADMFPGGVWVEAVQPGLTFQIDKTRMPVKITRDTLLDTWALDSVVWEDRRVGNAENNKIPSFIDKPINSMAFIQARLCFLTDNSVVFSRVDNERDFWKRSATTTTSDDRIDIESRLLDTGSFRTLTAHDKDIVIFGDSEQWVIPMVSGLTPTGVALQLASRYDNDGNIAPVTLGASLAYPVWDGTYTQFREFYTRDDTSSNDSEDLTAVVPTYITGRVKQMVSSTLSNILIVQTDEPNKLYVMQWHNQNGVRVMQSWHTWTLPITPKHMFFADGILVLISRDGATIGYYTINPSDDAYEGLGHNIYLDYRNEYTLGANNEIALLPNHRYTNDDTLVIGAANSEYAGMSVPFSITGDTLTVDDKLGTTLSGSWVVGNKYETKVELSELVYRDQQDRYDSSGTLRINNIQLRHANSGEYKARVTRSWGDYYNDVSETNLGMSRVVGAAQLGSALIDTGSVRIPVRERSEYVSIEVFTDTHLPYNLTGYDWHGQLSGSGQRRFF